MNERDIYATAKMMIERDKDEALLGAMMRCERFLKNRDLDGAKCWSRIADAIEWMQMDERLGGEVCH